MTVISEIKQKLDIVELVSSYVPLAKVGKSFKARCPFHTEKEPSFYVFPERQSWYCFGRCQTGGDVFAFLMKKENLSFGEALRALAARAGVSLQPQPEAEAQARERERLYRVNQEAVEFYHRRLIEAGGPAQEHLTRRNISNQSVMDFSLGYAPPGWRSLYEHLTGLGYPAEEVVAAGLAHPGERGEPYDLFRHRLVFPIREAAGKVCGFGARTLDDSHPKYINTPATPVFDKKSLLYGLDRAKDAIRKQDQAVIVEGYMDVIAAHQQGFSNTVATMGVALTQAQLMSLKRLTRNLVLALDPDEAGLEATLRGVEVASQALGGKVTPVVTWQGVVRYERILDAEIRVLALPPGKDPDEVALAEPERWRQLLEAAPPVMDSMLEALSRAMPRESRWQERVALVRRLKPLFDEIKDPVRWSYYLQQLSRRLGMEERLLASSLRHTPSARVKGEGLDSPPRSSPTLEERALALLLSFPQLKPLSQLLSPELLEDTVHREVWLRYQESPDLPSLRDGLEPPLQERLDQLLELAGSALEGLAPEKRESAFRSLVLRLRQRALRRLLGARREALAAGEASSPEDMELTAQLGQTERERRTLQRSGRT